MKCKNLLLTAAFFFLLMHCNRVNAQSPSIRWQKCIGGSKDEFAQNIIKLSDGNYLSCGTSNSTNGNFNAVHGSYDAFLLKTDGVGNIIWKKTYGGSDFDAFYNVIELNNGDIYAIGTTASADGQVSGHHGSAGIGDVWLAKLNSNGNLLSQHCYGGSGDDYSLKTIITQQGNIMFTAVTNSNDGDVSNNHGDYDGWVVKLNIAGGIAFAKTIGGAGYDDLTGLAQINGGFFVTGITSVETGELAEPVYDAQVAKLSNNGNIVYYRKYGGSRSDDCNAMVLAPDGNAVLAGHASSADGDVTGNVGFNAWIFKIDVAHNGDIIWQNFFGMPNDTTAAFNITTTHDGGYILAGATAPNKAEPLKTWDAYAAKVDAYGDAVWTKRFGGNKFDGINSLVEENDHSILMVGSTKSNEGDVYGNHGGPGDMWLVNFNDCSQKWINNNKGLPKSATSFTAVFPNPVYNSTTVSFFITVSEKVTIKIFDLHGKLIKVLADKTFEAGEQQEIWTTGNVIPGTYLLKIESSSFTETEKIIVIK